MRKVELRTALSPRDVGRYTAERLREEFLVRDLFVPGQISDRKHADEVFLCISGKNHRRFFN